MLRLVDAELHGHQCIPGPAKVMIGVACQQLARFSGMQVGPGQGRPSAPLLPPIHFRTFLLLIP